MEKEIPRATTKINPYDFKKLMHLTLKQTWLEYQSNQLTELWNLCKDRSEKELIYDLIYRFKYLTSKELMICSFNITNYIENNWGLIPKGTRVVATSKGKEPDGSQVILQSIKNKFSNKKWKANNFINNIDDGAKFARSNYTIILIDDFIGTGKTIEDTVKEFREEILKKKKSNVVIKVIGMVALEIAKIKLDALNIEYYAPIWLDKGITDHYKDDELIKAKMDMKRLESELAPKYNGLFLPSFGYKKSEALFAMEPYNVPNNVFPIFWWPVLTNLSYRDTLFGRLR
jgi:hypothetical protein